MSVKILSVKADVLGANDQKARANRELIDRHQVLMVNIMSSPGAGKTSLILQTIVRFKERLRMAVIEGDLASSIDADRISRHDVPAIQINTGGACHLDARMIGMALDKLELEQTDLIIIENVGNLICTADFALGAHKKVIILSVPEGDDKPLKYPPLFAEADVVLVNKIDVLPYFDFNLDAFSAAVRGLNPAVQILPVSAKTGQGLNPWFGWLAAALKSEIRQGREPV